MSKLAIAAGLALLFAIGTAQASAFKRLPAGSVRVIRYCQGSRCTLIVEGPAHACLLKRNAVAIARCLDQAGAQ